jgi:hypothetical protein
VSMPVQDVADGECLGEMAAALALDREEYLHKV